MNQTGKQFEFEFQGKTIHYLNQCCKKWDHPYLYMGEGDETLSSSGCGIFSLCHAVEYMNGIQLDPNEMADFAMKYGGRGDDGTDRPALLHALMETGKAKTLGFMYKEDGLRNDLDALFEHLYHGHGTAFCNLRVGHIVALVGARIVNGEKQLIAIDSVAESARDIIRNHVREVVTQSETMRDYITNDGLYVGSSKQYGMFYVTADLPRDFNLLYKL